MKISEDLVRATLVEDSSSAMVEQWIYWNNSPLRHVPAATVQQFFPESFYSLLQKNQNDYRVHAHIDHLLKKKLSWNHSVTWQPDDSLREISLITPPLFEKLSLLAGALSSRKLIARIIDGFLVRKLRQEIGDHIIEFALLIGSSQKYFFTPMDESALALEDIVGAIKKEAITIVENAFSAKERGVQERIATKLSGCFASQFYDTPLPLAAKAEKILNELWRDTSSWL